MVIVVANIFFFSLILQKYLKMSKVMVFIPLLQGRSNARMYPLCPIKQDI